MVYFSVEINIFRKTRRTSPNAYSTTNANNPSVIRFFIDINGNTGIGTNNPSCRLDVCGTIRANEVKVDLTQGGCDFVFKSGYKLMDLKDLDQFVNFRKHLPEIASEKEMVENGVNMKELLMKLLQKIEELTLYAIEQNKKIIELGKQNERIQVLEKKIENIELE